MMTTPKIDPSRIFLQADCFYQALAILCNVEPDNTQLAVILNEPMMVIGALTIELFLNCLSCIETGQVPRTHHLRELYDGLSPAIRARIEHTWDSEIVVHRATEWDHFEKSVGTKMDRDLPSALEVASKAYERIRYSYEGGNEGVGYYLQDLPGLLRRVILEINPEWKKKLRREYQEVPPVSNH